MGRVEGKNCIVTGAARGIGLAIGQTMMREGANVAFVDVDPKVAEIVAEANKGISGEGIGKYIAVQADVTKRADIQNAVAETVKAFGSLNVMFNNAGMNKPLNFLDVTEENWHQVMDVNALSVLLGTQEAAKQMIKQGGGGKVINTASVASRQGYPNMPPYSASKAAVISLTQSGARALAGKEITVNCFAPAVVLTPLWEQLDKDLVEIGTSKVEGEAIDMFSSTILLGRPGKPEEIAATALFLASSDADYITGQCIMVDGGKFLV